MIETVRVSEKAKIQLITLKRRTGIQNWNVLCRWALCSSLAEKSEPPNEDIPSDSSIEMTWKTFTGGEEEIYTALIQIRAHRVGKKLDKENLNKYFRLHLHRGISYLIGNTKLNKIEDLIRVAT
jgi:DNA sulfur modification protein DndE